MTEKSIIIRKAELRDAKALRDIYAPYVKNTAITFEYEIPSEEEFVVRMKKVQKRYPYFVAEQAGEILGYAYASVFHVRAAYDWAVETSIYLKESQKKRGLGRKLYGALEEALKKQNILNLYACIGYPEVEDEYLTKNSVEFHAHLGYRMIGEFKKCGYKFGRWYNMVWMEKFIGEHVEEPLPVQPFSDVMI
ncbi:MAG: GNAT family N-acetyltransferase [Dorea sp.]